MTSHQRQFATHPTRVTRVPPMSQVTVGNVRSGPERTLTELVMVAVSAAMTGMQAASAMASINFNCGFMNVLALNSNDLTVSCGARP
jgi:hypothetical protein